MTLRVSEIFYSIQGEGKYVGAPSVFLRLFGCNFTCSGFAGAGKHADPEKRLVEEKEIIATSSSLCELDASMFHSGCDSRYSWDRKYIKFTTKYEPDVLLDEIKGYRPNDKPVHLVITGGEPLLHQKSLTKMFARMVIDPCFTHVTIETNGSVYLTSEFRTMCLELALSGVEVVFATSVKLAHSGEELSKRVVKSAFFSMLDICQLHPRISFFFKFVTRNVDDVDEVQSILSYYERAIESFKKEKEVDYTIAYEDAPVYLMPLGGTPYQYARHMIKVVELAQEYGYYFSPRLHIDLFGNKIGT